MLSKLLKKISCQKISAALFWLILTLLVWNITSHYLDPDWGWHLQVGREIARAGQVPHVNLYNFSYTGNWVDIEWLSNWGLAKINEFGTYNLVMAFFVGLILSLVALLNLWLKRIFKDRPNVYFVMLLELSAITAMSPHLGVRCQDIALVFLVILFLSFAAIENRARAGGSAFSIQSILPALIWPPLLYLWSCLHGSFMLGLVVLAGWWGYQTILIFFSRRLQKIWPNLSWQTLSKKTWLGITILFLIAYGATWVTAYGPELYSFLNGYRGTYYQTHIAEWLPQYSYPFIYCEAIFLAFAAVALGSWFWKTFRLKNPNNIPPWLWFLSIVLFAMAIKSRRHFPLLAMAVIPFIIDCYWPLIQDFVTIIKKHLTSQPLIKIFKYSIILLIILAAANLASKVHFIPDPFNKFCGNYPCAGVNFLKQHPEYDHLKIFNDYGWGGFLIATYPQRLLFIDGRLPQLRLSEKTFLEEYNTFFYEDTVASQLQKHSIGLVFIKANFCSNRRPSSLELWLFPEIRNIKCNKNIDTYLQDSPDWQMVYSDRISIIYARRNNQ